MTEKNQDPASNFYTRGRHNNCSCIYISQNYHKLPRQTIRTNSNLLILFSIPKKDLRHIYEDIISNQRWAKNHHMLMNLKSKSNHLNKGDLKSKIQIIMEVVI